MGYKKVRCDIKCSKNLDFGVFGLYLCLRRSQASPQHNFRKRVFKFCIRFALTLRCEVRLHLSIAFESQLSSLCIRFALTLHTRSQAAPQP